MTNKQIAMGAVVQNVQLFKSDKKVVKIVSTKSSDQSVQAYAAWEKQREEGCGWSLEKEGMKEQKDELTNKGTVREGWMN